MCSYSKPVRGPTPIIKLSIPGMNPVQVESLRPLPLHRKKDSANTRNTVVYNLNGALLYTQVWKLSFYLLQSLNILLANKSLSQSCYVLAIEFDSARVWLSFSIIIIISVKIDKIAYVSKQNRSKLTIRRPHHIVTYSMQKVYGLYVTMWWGRRITTDNGSKILIDAKITYK